MTAEQTADLRSAKFGIQKVRASRYVYEYKNVWDPVKKRSKPLYRISVGKIICDEIIINDEYLRKHPELRQGDFVLRDGKPVYAPKTTAPAELFRIKQIDHFVLTTAKPAEMAAFYRTLGLPVNETEERLEVLMPNGRINIHIVGTPLLPEAAHPTPGSGDFCLEIDSGTKLEEIAQSFRMNGFSAVGPNLKHGARGEMHSIYLRDPDQNLIELCVYDEKVQE